MATSRMSDMDLKTLFMFALFVEVLYVVGIDASLDSQRNKVGYCGDDDERRDAMLDEDDEKHYGNYAHQKLDAFVDEKPI